MLTIILFILGFVFLLKGADFLLKGSVAVARIFRIPDIVVGLTIVAFGTSAPELIVNLFASMKGSTDIALGNILGSNIINVLLILGLAAVIYPLKILKNTVWKEIPLGFFSVVILGLLANDRLIDKASASGLSRIDGCMLLCFFIIFLYYIFSIIKEDKGREKEDNQKQSFWLACFLITIGCTGLYLGGLWVVNGVTMIAGWIGLSKMFISLTIVALGTSLPELVTSLMAVMKKNADIAVGNIIGSNIFNVFFILGISSLIRPLVIDPLSNLNILILVFIMLLLFFFMFAGRKKYLLERYEGIIFILFYVGYIIFLIKY